MGVFRRLFALAFVCLASLGAAQLSDQLVAERILGPRWQELSRSAGMIFSGTVLKVETRPAGRDWPVAVILIKFRVDRAIAGVRSGEVLTVREWSGAWSMHRAMRTGQRMLMFLYPPSRLGLTSPVGGPVGQVVLDPAGEIVALSKLREPSFGSPERASAAEAGVDSGGVAARQMPRPLKAQSKPDSFQQVVSRCSGQSLTLREDCASAAQSGSVLDQLERAIRSVRRNKE